MRKSETSVVIVSHPDLLSADAAIWKPMYKRLRRIAKLKGHPLAVGIPALGYASFDGKQWRRSAFVAFEFEDWRTHNDFAESIKKISGIRAAVSSKIGWFDRAREVMAN